MEGKADLSGPQFRGLISGFGRGRALIRPMKITISALLVALFACGCSKNAVSTDVKVLPQFHIINTDVTTASVSVVTGQITANPTQEVALLHITLVDSKAAEFQKFTREHLREKIQVLVLGKVTIQPVVLDEISSGQIDVPYSS